MNTEDLYFLHAKLNQKFFDGELEAVVLKMKEPETGYDRDTDANFCGVTDPFIITFNAETIREMGTDTEGKIYIATVLLHEMVHQYCYEYDIEDIDQRTGEHTEPFRAAAEDHGLIQMGYKLEETAREIIEEELKKYEIVKG